MNLNIIFLITYLLYDSTMLIESARILAVSPIPSYNHYANYHTLWAALSRRGHKVIVITAESISDPSLTNLTEISIKFSYESKEELNFVHSHTDTWLTVQREFVWAVAEKVLENIYEHPEVRKMYAPNSGQQFDVVFTPYLSTPGLYALAHRFNASLIGLSPSGLSSYHYFVSGAPVLTSHSSVWEIGDCVDSTLSLWKKIKNFIQLWYHIYCTAYHLMPAQQALAERYLGKDIPHISDIEKNISIIFYNQLDVLLSTRPRTQNIIPFGYSRISKKLTVLPKDVKQFVDDAPNGFIYINLGTNVATTTFSKLTQNTFLRVLANLPYKVLWKTDVHLTDIPDNIYIAKRFPQQSILAHPKIKLFIYEGEIKSTEEAIYYAVPLLGLPVMSDQFSNVNKLMSLDVGKCLLITDISIEALNASIMDILNDKRYKERMLKLKVLSEDVPYDYLTNAIWWTEYVIRRKHTHHFHVAYPWYQTYDLDVIVILSIATFVMLLCVIIITSKLLKIIFHRYMKISVALKKKNN